MTAVRLLGYQPSRGYYNELLNFHALQGTEEIAVTPEVESVISGRSTRFSSPSGPRYCEVDRTPAYA